MRNSVESFVEAEYIVSGVTSETVRTDISLKRIISCATDESIVGTR